MNRTRRNLTHSHDMKTNMERMAPRAPNHEAIVVPVYTFTPLLHLSPPVGTSTQHDKRSSEAARRLIENTVDLAGWAVLLREIGSDSDWLLCGGL